MHLTTQQVMAMTEQSLREFLGLSIPEGLYLDYKEGLSGTSDKEAKREFLKDVTAFANAAGGHLFLGVREPAEGLSVDEQLVGLDSGDTLAHDLERVASSSIDPRIPGLRIVPVSLSTGRACIIVHIPPSLSRPHMVSHAGHLSFYVRHSESSFPMTTHEVREAVLTSSSAEARARLFVDRRLREVRELIDERQPAFFIQAMPLIAPEVPWDVLSTPFETLIRGDARRNKFHYVDLASNYAARPTIDGLLGEDQHDSPTWETEVHRTGYISLLYRNSNVEPINNVDRFILHVGICDIFGAFCHMIKECLELSATDVPYLLTCTYLNAEGTCMWTSNVWHKFSAPYKKKDITWPEHFRATGSDPMVIAESLCLKMFNAFGSKGVVK
ncbi:MAG: helix-turn-helix domain-containing protein [Thiobacillaceae bacterium]